MLAQSALTIDYDKEELAAKLKGSFLFFTRFFFEAVAGREFTLYQPICRESHQVTIARELTRVFRRELNADCLGICVPPRLGKSVFVSMWVAWCYAHYPDCNFLYISYSHDLAAKHTAFIKLVMLSPHYQYLFDTQLKKDSRAKDKFQTTANGSVAAFGSGGAIVGQDAGLPNLNRFGGAVLLDDPIKIDDASSDRIRKGVLDNYKETIVQRAPNNVPIVFIGQRAHEDDPAAFFQSGNDIKTWEFVNLEALDAAENALCPEVHSKELLLRMRDKSPYVFAAQMQQNPLPAGGGLFKQDWFITLDNEPEYLSTFITADTAETEKTWNDATVFSFWGFYEIEGFGKKTGEFGIHWLDCLEIRVEPHELEQSFLDFYAATCQHPMPPSFAAIEKKSTGVTLVPVLQKTRGLSIRPIERTIVSGSKTQRFINCQPYISGGQVTLPTYGKHTQLCIDHMTKITANNSHRFDDIADTAADAIKIALIDKAIYMPNLREQKHKAANSLAEHLNRRRNLGTTLHG